MLFHGGMDTSSYLDFSVNVPVKMPSREAQSYLEASFSTLCRYPSIDNREPEARMSDFLGTSVLIGNGATQLIYAVARTLYGKKVLIVQPAFTEYRAALKHSRILDFNFTLYSCRELKDALITEMQTEKPDAVFLCNPNNPIGCYFPDLIKDLLSSTDALIVVDESFIDFVDDICLESHFAQAGALIRAFPDRLVIIRSMTKAFSVPGLRLGYLCAGARRTQTVRDEMEPWSVNALASAYLSYLLDRNRIVDSRVSGFKAERMRCESILKGLGAESMRFASCVNFYFFRLKPGLNTYLNSRGMHLRTCADFVFLDDTCYRAAVRQAHENDRLLEAISDFVKEG